MSTFGRVKSVLMTAVIGFFGSAFGIGAPMGLSVAPIDYTQTACNIDCSARLIWTAPAEGTPTGYKVYRRLAAHEHPTLAGSVGADATSFTDSTATVGALYLYTVTAVDGDGESAESNAVSHRKVKLISGTDCGSWSITEGTVDTGNKFTLAGLYDGSTTTGTRSGNWATYADTFKEPAVLSTFRIIRPADFWNTAQGPYYLKGYKADSSDVVNFVKAASDQSSTQINTTGNGTWEAHATHADYAETPFSKVTIRSVSAYFSFFYEVECYGYFPSAFLGTPAITTPIFGDGEVLLSWTAAAKAVSYSIYRKAGDGAWETLGNGLTVCAYKDTGLTDGTVYTYRVAAVAANGDESSAAEGLVVTAKGTVAEIPPAYGLVALPIDFSQADCNVDCSAHLSWSLVSAACYDKVRVYRFIKGHEDETPAPIATLDKTTTYVDTTATVGRDYLYKVACFSSSTGLEGPLSNAVNYRKVKNLAKHNVNGTWAKTAGEPLTSWGNWKTWDNLSDGVAGTESGGIRIEGNGTLAFTFTSTARPKLVAVRAMSANKNNQTAFICRGTYVREGVSTTVAFDGGSTTVNFPIGVWTTRVIAPAYADDVWSVMELKNSSGSWQYPCFSEVEAYGYVPGDTTGFLAAPELNNPVANKKAVSLTWTAAANAASYTIYRKAADGVWSVAYENVTATTLEDEDVTFDGTTYTYRVVAVAANGDELSSAEKMVLCPAGAPFWWNFLNVKSVAFPGAAGYANPEQVKPHYMSRDKAGTLLAVPMSTDNGTHPAVTFDFAALASADSLGELSTAQSGMKQYGIFTDFGGAFGCWKGAAVSADLVVIGNGGTDDEIAVVERATGACMVYRLVDESGTKVSFTMDGGLDFDAAGTYLYTNDGVTQNRIVKWQVNVSAKTLKKVAEYTISGFTRIRNLAIYTVGSEEYAFFGEGSAKTGKIGTLKLADGSIATVVTDATNLAGDIMNVTVAAADGATYVVVQLDTAAVGIYALTAATMTATHEEMIDAATMKGLYGTADGGQYRNFEMTADGRYAFVMNNAGAATRLSVIGANEPLLPGTAPELTVTSDYSNKFTPTLNWIEADGVGAESVRIFRAQVGKPGAIALADVPLGTQTYVDEAAIAGVPYAYSIAYVHTVNGEPLVGVRSAEIEAMALIDLKTKKKAVLSSTDKGKGTLNNLFDDNTATVHGDCQWAEQDAMQFTERVQLMAARYWPKTWGTIHRGDNLKVYGNVEKGTSWTEGKIQVGTGPVVNDETWYDVTLNSNAAPEAGWDYLTLASGYSAGPYLNLAEVDFYGALPVARAAALEKASEAGRDDAPTAAFALKHALSWTESGDCTAVHILRARTKEGPFVEIARVPAGTETFVDATAVDGVVYYYQFVYETEFEGVGYVGTPSAVVVDYGDLLSENGKASKQYLRETNPVIASKYSNGPDRLFDGNLGNDYNNDQNAMIGQAFRAPVVVNHVRIFTLGWAASDTYKRADNIGIYGAPADWSGTSGNAISSISGAVKIGSSPATCRGEAWFDCTLTDPGSAWSYLVLYRNSWWGNLREIEFYGYPLATVEAAKDLVVWPVEDVAARMDDTTLTLSWTLANTLATSITVKHRVADGAWTEIATLKGDATTFTTDEVAIGRYNEYRLVLSDGNEVVWAEKDFAVCPLLSKGTRTALGCTATQAWDYLTVDSASEFAATFKLAGSTQETLGLTPGKGNGKTHNLYLRKSVDATPAVQIQRHWVEGNTLGWYAYDAATAQTGWNYAIVWSAENDSSTTFKINRSGTSYRLRTAAAGEALADTANYTFVGDDHLDNGPCLVGVQITDPNLKTLPQIAPVEVKVSVSGLAIIVR